MTLYLLHFDGPIATIENVNGNRYQVGQDHPTRHYLGFAGDGKLRQRLEAHAMGRSGVKMMRVLFDKGIGWELVRTWPGGDRTLERYLKQRNGLPKMCPVCSPGTRQALHVDVWFDDPYRKQMRHAYFHRDRLRRPGMRFRVEGRQAVEEAIR